MLANVSHSPVWRSQGYVCLACRRQQLRIHRQQRRSNSETQHTSTSAGGDSWFDTLNDISDSFSTPRSIRSNPEPAPKVTKRAEAKGRKDPFDDFRNSLEFKVESPRGTRPPTVSKLIKTLKGLRQSASAKPSTHRAKRRQRRASQETAQDVYADSPTVPEATKSTGGMVSMDALIEQLKEIQQEKASEDDERLSWTKAAQDLMEMGEKEKDDEDGGDVAAEESGLRPLPAFNVTKTRRSFRPTAAAGDTTQGRTSKMPNQLKDAPASETSADSIAKYKAKTSPAASGLGGRLEDSEREPVSMRARWLKQQKQAFPYGVQRQTPATSTSSVSFDSLRRSDKLSYATPVESKTSSPFGLGFASWRSQAAGNTKVEANRSDDSQSAAKSQDEVLSKGKLPDMDSLRASLQALNKVEKVPKVAEQGTRYQPVVESRAESAIEGNLDTGTVKAHESLASLYRVRYSSPRQDSSMSGPTQKMINPPSKTEAVEAGHTIAARVVRHQSSVPPMPAGQTIADAMRDGRDAKQDSGSTPPQSPPSGADPPQKSQASSEQIVSLDPSDVEVKPLDIPQPHVPYLGYGLDRVLFNPGVYQLQDPTSRVYNFDPYLQDIMPVTDFDFNALKAYKTSSQDEALSELANKEGKRYIGSTSSMTSSLAHFHYLLSNFRPINTTMYSREFSKSDPRDTFTEINRAPSAIFLRWKNGTYAIDADKEYDGGNVLMLLGKSMELLLTLPKDDYERYRKSDPRQVPEEQRAAPESYQYTTMRDFLMRSQLDACDPRLPGNGTFDVKTRAVVSIRMSASDYKPMTGYELFNLQGKWGSYEKEYYDMTRSTMLKYMLQARMGRMNGIFVAYHNVKRIFGFQYIPMHEMDRALHGQTDTCLGDKEFRASLDMMNEIFNKATAKFPNQSLRFHFETRPERDDMPTALHVFAEPMTENEIDTIQNSQKAKIAAFERDIMGKENQRAVDEDNENLSLGFGSGNTVEAESSDPIMDDNTTNETNNDDVALGKETSTVHSTEAPADRVFLNSIATQDDTLKPLFYATVIVQSKVDGEYLKGDRPTDLKKNQKWEIDYILKEYEISRHQWALYEDSKARRRHAFYDGSDDDDADVDAQSDKGFNSYLHFLRQMSQRGAEIRAKVDKMDAGKEVVTVEKPLPREREVIERVEDYMEWMYREKDV
ncbi:hypothetical protein DOTSEDRAFT_72422 [Dothistroma septosporum NZE10]|uniref:Pet127-domain-containing protein n=1 Tax=Dothistroma septosporum (strain NZE10 / CBS 128990) TaxID=675120 RepID=M2YM85_DOTSN|nr:hypothetical protein DOTSEDRAFT_72422 [Dothistroma septosporum NZE10]